MSRTPPTGATYPPGTPDVRDLIRQRREAVAGGQGDVRALIRQRRKTLETMPQPQADLLAGSIESSFRQAASQTPAATPPAEPQTVQPRRRSALDILRGPTVAPREADSIAATGPAGPPVATPPPTYVDVPVRDIREQPDAALIQVSQKPSYDSLVAAGETVAPGLRDRQGGAYRGPQHGFRSTDADVMRVPEPSPEQPAPGEPTAFVEQPDATRVVPQAERHKAGLGKTAFDVFMANAYPGFLGKEMEDRAIGNMDPNAPGRQLPGGYHGGDLIGLAAYEGTAVKEVLGYLGILGKMAGGAVNAALPKVTSMPVVSRIADAIIEKSGVGRDVAGRVAGRVAGALDGIMRGAPEGLVFGAMRQPLEGEEVTPEVLASYAAGGAILQGIIGGMGGRGWSLADPMGEVPRIQDTMTDPYAALGLKHGATPAEVNAAFRKQAAPFHPDQNRGPMAEEIFKKYAAAKQSILDSATPEEAIRSYSKTMGASPVESTPPQEKPAEKPSRKPKPRAKATEPSPTEDASKAATEPPAASAVTESVTEPVAPEKAPLKRRVADWLDPSRKQELSAKEEELRRAHTDEDTGVGSKVAFQSARERIDSDPAQEWVSGDVVGLKNRNDNLSPKEGTAFLRHVAEQGVEVAKEMGINPRNVMRPGGDEFGAAVPAGQGKEFGRRWREKVGEHPIGDTGLVSALRFGVASTWEEAASAAQAAKEMETDPKYKRGGPPIKAAPEPEAVPAPESEAPLPAPESATEPTPQVEPEWGYVLPEFVAPKPYVRAPETPAAAGTEQPPAPDAAPAPAPDAPIEGHGERVRRTRWQKGKVVPTEGGVSTTKPTVTFEEEYADGTLVTRAEDGTVLSTSPPLEKASSPGGAGERLYVRFGPAPDEGPSRNLATGEPEAGVSVYPAVRDPRTGEVRIQFTPEEIAEAEKAEPGSKEFTSARSVQGMTPEMAVQHHGGRQAHLVSGREVGRGSDGEPLLAGVRVVAPLSPGTRAFRQEPRAQETRQAPGTPTAPETPEVAAPEAVTQDTEADTIDAKPEPTRKPRKLKKGEVQIGDWVLPKRRNASVMDDAALAAYFTPGEIVEPFTGERDRVLEFTPGGKDGRMEARVQAVDAQGNPDEPPRTHSTYPDRGTFEQVMRERGAWVDAPGSKPSDSPPERVDAATPEEWRRGTEGALGDGAVREPSSTEQYHARDAFGSGEAEATAARGVVALAGGFAETVEGPLDARHRLEVVDGLRSRAWVSVAGKRVHTAHDAHQVLAPFFRSKTMEILHAVYVDEAGVVLANESVTSGALDYVRVGSEWVERVRTEAKRLGALRVWMVHNHPSGDPTPSADDFRLWRTARDELAGDVDVQAVVIDSDTYADLQELEKVPWTQRRDHLGKVRGAPPEPRGQVVGGPEIAAQLMRVHHDPRKFGVLYLNTRHEAVALELHGSARRQTLAKWLGARAKAYGAYTAIIGVHGDPVPLARDLMRAGLTGSAPGGVLDVVEVTPPDVDGYYAERRQTGWVIRDTRGSPAGLLADAESEGQALSLYANRGRGRSARALLTDQWGTGSNRLLAMAGRLAEETADYDPAPTDDADEGIRDIRPVPEPRRLAPADVDREYTEAGKALVKALPRHTRYRKTKAKQAAQRWRETLTEEQREDIGGYVEGIGNIRTGKSGEDVAAEVKSNPKMRRVVSEYRDLQEQARGELNALLEDLQGPEYIKFLEDYLLHVYAGPAKKRTAFARSWAKKVPSAAKRRIPTLDAALDAGLTPLTQDVADLHQLWAEMNWKGALNQRFVYELAQIKNADGLPVIMKPKHAPADWVYVDHPAIQKVYARKAEDGTLILWRGGAMVDPDVYQPLRQVFEHPLSWKPLRAVETLNAFAKKSALSFSFFHHFALTESAQASLARWWNPVRGLALAERGLRGGIRLGPMKLTRPHLEGLRLLDHPEFMRDAILHGLTVDPIPDVMAGRIVRALRGLEASTRTVPVLGHVTRRFRQVNDWWDTQLWNRYHTGLKAFTYYDFVSELMQRMPEGAPVSEVTAVKEKVAELVNDMFGGQEWEAKFWLTPQGRQMAHLAVLAPDWTLSNLNVATKPLRGINDPTTRHVLGRYWRNMLLSFFAMVAGATRALNGKWPWEQEPEHKLDIDVTPIMRALAKVVPDWLPDWVPGADPAETEDERRYFIRPGKQFREVVRYVTDPIGIVGAKLSPLMQVALEQMTGHQPGQDGWDMPWVQDELTWYESMPSRLVSVADKFVPFAVQGNNFAFTFPMSRGMSWYKAQKAYEDVIRAQVDPTLYDRLMPGRDAERLKSEIDAAATLNGLDPEEQYKQANTKVRSEYYARMWAAIEDEELDEAEGVAAILYKLGANATGMRASGERRGVTDEEVETAVRKLPGRYVRPARKERRTRRERTGR